MSSKSEKINRWVAGLGDGDLDPRYLGFFQCFNQQRYFEAHEVLEDLWLLERQGPNEKFYRGLIQLAGAFVHFQKMRPHPALSLLKLSAQNLRRYPAVHLKLNVATVSALIEDWQQRAARLQPQQKALEQHPAPRLVLESATGLA